MKLIQSGPRNAKIMFVGEAPGETEMKTGVPFSGGSGDLLNRMLGNPRIDINRDSCFFTNVCHIQPQGKKKNDFSWFFSAEGMPHLQAGILRLMADVREIRPNLVVALGAVPMYMLTRKGTLKSGKVTGIDKWRGSILESVLAPGQKVIPTYHPAFLLRSWDHKAVAELDLARCAGDAQFPELRLPQRELYLNPQGSARRELMASFLDTDELSVDIECWEDDNGKWHLACVGFSDRPDRALVIHAASRDDLDDISRMVGSPCDKVMQNGQFDYTVLTEDCQMEVVGFGEHVYADGKLVRVRGWDTMLAHHSLYLESAGGDDEYSALKKERRTGALKKGLAFINSIYTREPFYKDDGKLWKETSDLQMFWRYNALDAAVTREIQLKQRPEIREWGIEDVFMRKMQLLQPLMACTRRGIRVDVPARQALRREIETQVAGLQIVLDTIAGRPINVKSTGLNGDVGKLLYQDLGLPIQYKQDQDSGEHRPTVDKDAIISLAAKYQHPALLAILNIRERRTVLEGQLGDNVGSDGRMRCNYDPTGTRTNRISSRETIRGEGTNLQNQMDRIRRLYIPSPGRVFIQPDYSQAEARVVAYLAREDSLIQLLEDPTKDIHRFNASRFYGLDETEITYEMRYCAKRGTHSANYGVGAEKTMKVINQDAKDTWGKPGTGVTVDLATARQIVEGYFALYPRIKSIFWSDIREQLRRDRTLVGVFGTKRTFFGRWDGNDEGPFLNAAYSFIPQNAVGELGTMALVAIEREVKEATVLGNVHDSILVECDDDPGVVQRVVDQMRELMRIPITVHGRTFYIPTEFAIGYNWGKQGKPKKKGDPIENPQGLGSLEQWLEKRGSYVSAN